MNNLAARLRAWLGNIPIDDPIQRRMATLLQVMLLGLMMLIVVATLLRLILPDASAQEGSRLSVGNLIGFIIILLPFVLLRRGFFRAALLPIVALLILTPTLAILVVYDLPNNGGVLFQFTLAIFLAGLLTDRRALLFVFGLSALLVTLSAIQAQNAGLRQAELAFQTALNFILFNGLITLFLDRFGITLRTALTDSLVREGELHDEIANRKHAETSLRESEERYRVVSGLTSDYAYKDVVLPDGGISPEWITNSFTRITGYTLEDARAPDFWMNVIHPDDAPVLLQHSQRILSGVADTAEFRVRTKGGGVRWFKDFANPIWDQQAGRVGSFFGAVQDITDHKSAGARFRMAIESAPNAILMVDATGQITLVNSQAEKYFGYPREALIGAMVDTLIPERFRAGHPGHREDFLSEPQPRPMGIGHDLYGLRKDGSEFPVEIGLAPIETPEGTLVMATIVDITERKQAEERRLQIQERFEKIFNHSPMSMALSSVKDGKYLEVNQAFLDLMGYAREEVIGHTSLDLNLIHPEDRGRILEALKSGSFRSAEAPIHPKNGQVKQIRIYAQEISIGDEKFFLSMNEDITERKRAEEENRRLNEELEQRVADRTAELTKANSLLNAMLDYVPDHIFFKDRQSRFIRNSRSQAEMMGLDDPAETVGKTDFDFFPHAQRAFEEEQKIINSAGPIVDLEEHVVWPNGRETWVSTTKVPLREPSGEIIGLFGIARDITDRKHAEESLRKAKAQLEAANKELESFSYSVSHDLRAPLRAIDGYSRMLLEDYESRLDAEGRRLFNVVRSEAQRMGQLIDDLLAFSRLGRAEMRYISMDMRSMVETIFNELTTPEARKRIDFQLGDVPGTWGDPSLIRQVWVNLISNAIKFSSAKERAIIQVQGKEQDGEIVYEVRDNGAGFDMKYAAKLFGVFQRLHSEREFEGTGVGLAIIQRIISRHGGRVWAEGEPGNGAAFYFALPEKGNQS